MEDIESNETKPINPRVWRTIVVSVIVLAHLFLDAGKKLAHSLSAIWPDINVRAVEDTTVQVVLVSGIIFVTFDWIHGIIRSARTKPKRKLAS